jgi:hypothetical protein
MKRLAELDVEVSDDEALEHVCKAARELLKEAGVSLSFLAADLEARLNTLDAARGVQGGLGGLVNTRARARLVASHLRNAGDACTAGAISSTKCWRSFVKHFAPEIDAARRKTPVKAFEIKGR